MSFDPSDPSHYLGASNISWGESFDEVMAEIEGTGWGSAGGSGNYFEPPSTAAVGFHSHVDHAGMDFRLWADAFQNSDTHGDLLEWLEPGHQVESTLDTTTSTQPKSTSLRLRFSSIRVDRAWDTHFMSHLESLNAPNLQLFFMDLANVTWNHTFTQLIARRPTWDVCERIITETCQRRLSSNPEWELEEGMCTVSFDW